MGQTDFEFLRPLFDLVGSMADDDDVADMSFGLGEPGSASPLARDDAGMEGVWVSMVAMHGISAALDHVVALRSLVIKAQEVTVNAPWTLLRGALEPAGVALWILSGSNRDRRREHTLRVWVHDLVERQKWERDTGLKPVAPAKSSHERIGDVHKLAKRLGLRPNQVATRLSYSQAVADAAATVGWSRADATARWREAAAFAHGRSWPLFHLTTAEDAEIIRGGVGLRLTLNETRLGALAGLTLDILNGAVDALARLSLDGPD